MGLRRKNKNPFQILLGDTSLALTAVLILLYRIEGTKEKDAVSILNIFLSDTLNNKNVIF